MPDKKVAVIGGGAAGLCAARHCTGASGVGSDVTVFEQTSQLGGTWVYTEETDTDQSGVPVHTSMYKNLRTNRPKEVMGFPDYEMPEREESYLSGNDVLEFLNDYADHFDLRKYIKFNHQVRKVTPEKDGRWEVQVLNFKTNTTETDIFDAVMVCNGNYHTPLYPSIKGTDTFPGPKFHSHNYREPEKYESKKVLVIGGGPSGLDIALDISEFADKVIISHHCGDKIKTKFPSNIVLKSDVTKVENSTIHFDDGTEDTVDVILFCTGYVYSFPFLSNECNVTIEENVVQPLYKHFLHIDYPTICFIGLPFYICHFMLFDLQIRVFLRILSGEIPLPSQEEMKADVEREIKWRRSKGLLKKQFHMMGQYQGLYFDELSTLGKLPLIPPVYTKLHNESSRRFLEDLVNYRKDNYKIIDENNFIQIN